MKEVVKTILSTRTQIFILAITLVSCSSKHLSKSKNETVLSWMKNENVPTVGICLIENSKIKEVRIFGDIEYHSPAPLNTLFNLASLTKPLISRKKGLKLRTMSSILMIFL